MKPSARLLQGNSRPSIPTRTGGLPLAKYSPGDCRTSPRACLRTGAAEKKAGPLSGTGPKKLPRSRLGLFLPHVDFGVDARSHQLKLFEPLLGLLAPCSSGVELVRLLVGFDGSRRELYHFFIADFLRRHLVNQRRSQEIPGLRIFWIKLGGFLQGFDGVAKPIRVVQADPKVAPCGCGVRWVEFRALRIRC